MSSTGEILPEAYPAMWETHAVLADGSPVELRPVRPSDRARIEQFHRSQSPESIYFRFFQHRPELSDKELDYFTQVDYARRMAFVALIGGKLVAVARYESGESGYSAGSAGSAGSEGGDRPEVAFFVDDGHHGLGLATLLLEYLAAAARSRGILGFTASVLPENYAMLGVFRRAGFGIATRFEDGVIQVELDIALTVTTTNLIAERQSRARSRSVARLLRPTSVAVVGASRQAGSVGHELLRSLTDGHFTGRVFPVNPAADEVLGQRCYASLEAIGEPVDLAVVAVPAAEVESVMAEAVAIGVGAMLIVSSGFADVGPVGAEREQRLVRMARSNGMRVVGPNAFGMVNTAPDVALRALFVPLRPMAGPVGLMSESGPLGGAVLDRMRRSGVGISSFVAAGNRADVSVNDLLDYWLLDEATEVVLLHVENFGNLRTFASTAGSVSRRKPIVAVRPPDDDLVELLERCGVIQVEGVSELADMARVAATQPLPAGRRVAVVSNAASVGRLAAAACRRYGLELAVPGHLLGGATVAPARTGPGSGPGMVLVADVDIVLPDDERHDPDYNQILVGVAASAEVDAVLVVLVPTLELSVEALATVLAGVSRSIPKPMVAAGLIEAGTIAEAGTRHSVPLFTFPEDAARALGRLAGYAEWRERNQAERSPADVELTAAVGLAVGPPIRELLGSHRQVDLTLWSPGMAAVVETWGLPVVPWRLAGSRDEVLTAADELGYPVVLKAASAERRNVGEVGGTAIDLHDRHQLGAAFERMTAVRGPGMLPAAVQRLVASTANAKLELVQDPVQGAFVTLGVGGSVGATLAPLARRYLPLVAGDPEEMVAALAASMPLDDGAAPALTRMVEQLGRLAGAVPELARVSLDPVLVAGPDTAAADAYLVVRSLVSDPLAEVRRL